MTEPFESLAANSTILMVEDNDDDAFLMRRAFKKAHLLNPLIRVHGGEEAIAYLKGEGRFANRTRFPMPFLVLLDLNMPCLNGFDVLKWIRQQDNLENISVVILTASTREPDVKMAYELGANSYLSKPADFEQLMQLLTRLQGYWLITNTTPENSPLLELELA